jgi:hypothetical protein
LCELGALGADQQCADEQRMPGEFGEDARFYPVFRVGAAIEILREELLAFRVFDKVVVENLEVLLRELAVALPPHALFSEGVDNGVLVLGAASGVNTGLGAQRATGDDLGLAARNRMLVERGRGQIPMSGRKVFQAELVGAKSTVADAGLLHGLPPRNASRLLPGTSFFPPSFSIDGDGPLEGAAP